MGVIHIALEDGFRDDHVIVRVNGGEVLERDGVSTRYQIGLAHTLEVPVTDAPVHIEVILPERRIRGQHTVDGAESAYVGASVQGGAITFRQSPTPFGYV